MKSPFIKRAIVARCPGCHLVVYAATNMPKHKDRRQAEEIGNLVLSGHIIEHTTTDAIKQLVFGCTCRLEATLDSYPE
jgi:hypothetical protein